MKEGCLSQILQNPGREVPRKGTTGGEGGGGRVKERSKTTLEEGSF